MTDNLMDALRHALGARWVRVMAQGSPMPAEEVSRGLRRRETHHLTVELRGTDTRLVCALPRLPTQEDTLLAGAVARTLEPPAPAGPARASEVLQAFAAPVERRAEALLELALRLTGTAAGGLSLSGTEPQAWTSGPGRPVLRRAALAAADAPAGDVELSGRRFTVIPLTWNAEPVGGLAIEGTVDSEDLRAFASSAAAALRSARPGEAAPSGPAGANADLRAVLSTIPLAAVAVDGNGHLIGASPEAEQIFGFVADFDLGTDVRGRLRSPVMENLLFGETQQAGEVELGDRIFEPLVVMLPSGGRVAVLHDRSDAETLERLQENLVASVAHELRTPIAAVQGLVQLLKLRASKLDPDKLAALLDDGEREIVRLERLVEDLLLAARVATGGIVAVPDAIDLRPIAEEVVHHASPRYPDRRFVVDGDQDAYADPALVRHAIWHLVDNAAKFGPLQGTVRVELAAGRDGPEVHVSDEGEGIFSGDIPKLFRRFGQLDASATRQHGGAGLGLFLVKAILDAQGGRVWVKSRLGQGSTFSFALPAVPEE